MIKKKCILIFFLCLTFISCSSLEQTKKNLNTWPLNLPAESDPEANTHNEEGISHYKEGHFDIALKHFREAGKIQSKIGEIHFNEALALDKLGDHGDAAKHFKVAEENANGNTLILESKILLAHTR